MSENNGSVGAVIILLLNAFEQSAILTASYVICKASILEKAPEREGTPLQPIFKGKELFLKCQKFKIPFKCVIWWVWFDLSVWAHGQSLQSSHMHCMMGSPAIILCLCCKLPFVTIAHYLTLQDIKMLRKIEEPCLRFSHHIVEWNNIIMMNYDVAKTSGNYNTLVPICTNNGKQSQSYLDLLAIHFTELILGS